MQKDCVINVILEIIMVLNVHELLILYVNLVEQHTIRKLKNYVILVIKKNIIKRIGGKSMVDKHKLLYRSYVIVYKLRGGIYDVS